ncbi:MAG: L-aspartate oxidase [Victivallales bacterium]|nr:L-aspartate oxidase [Victivallales bacterium]
MEVSDCLEFDHIVIGSGIAGLSSALYLAEAGGSVAIITKSEIDECNTKLAQGGIACVLDKADSFEAHIKDTLYAGAGLCKEDVVRKIIETGPEVVHELIARGAHFTTRGELGEKTEKKDFDLGREGGHSQRRVLHAGDITGEEIERILIKSCIKNKKIKIFKNHISIDLIINRQAGQEAKSCAGVYALDRDNKIIKTFRGLTTTIATGGNGKVYLYTSNPDIACGAGVAMGYRAGAKIANMEFIQFHPTILHDPKIRSFLISEAVRGEGAVLKSYNKRGKLVSFMKKYHPMKSLAPRDVVARAIDSEMKRSGQECVYLDITNHDEKTLRRRFPNIFKKCLEAGINMAKDPIPVVPAAHYSCGGILTDVNGATEIAGLYAVGEAACTGLHGANRLASNSLLEAMVLAKLSYQDIYQNIEIFKDFFRKAKVSKWTCGNATDSDELVVISHNWDEIRHFMWDYVGIFRTNKRLQRAKTRIKLIRNEIEKYYWDFLITPDLIELRNIASTAEIIIDSALSRKESRGLNFNSDYPERDVKMDCVDTILQRKF